MKRIALNVFSLFFCFPFFAFCQGGFEMGGFAGIAQYQGDLAEDNIEFNETSLSGGVFLRIHLGEYFALRPAFFTGTITGDDANAKSSFRKDRGWRFSAKVNELTTQLEWHILGIRRTNHIGRFKRHFTPLVFTGVGISFSDASVIVPDGDLTVFPEPDDTDTFLVIPIGAGVRFDVSKVVTLGAEAGWRTVFSDHLDDVAKNGTGPDKNDWYSFIGVNLSLNLGSWILD